jgi:hypothetical protein
VIPTVPARAALIIAAISFLAIGCSSSYPTVDTRMEGAEASFDVPPKELLARVKQALVEPPIEIGVAEENKGSILTGYKRYPGEWRVGRRWQEQTRFRIRVTPDFDEPTKRSSIVITENTEQRGSEGMKWESLDVLPRPERAAELLRQLQPKLAAGGAATQPAK